VSLGLAAANVVTNAPPTSTSWTTPTLCSRQASACDMVRQRLQRGGDLVPDCRVGDQTARPDCASRYLDP